MMGLYSRFMRGVLFPGMDVAKGTAVIKYWKVLEKSQWLMREDIVDMQAERLRSVVEHAYRNVPYYNKLFKDNGLRPEDIKTRQDLKKLPMLTRANIRSAGKEMLATNWHQLKRQKPIGYTTSGSTAEPLRFFLTPESLSWAAAAKYRAWGWAGYRFGDRVALVWGSHMDQQAHQKTAARLKDVFRRQIMMDAFKITEDDLRTFAEEMADFRPRIIRGYATGVYLLARYMEKHPNERIEPRAVITTAETLFPPHRQLIEEVFGCQVFDWYGSRETSLIAHECKEHSGYHISAENSVLEFIADGEEVEPGEVGQITITDLHNYAMPFIRYDIGDAGRTSEEKCPCGRGLPTFAKVEGRVADFIVSANGDLVSPGFFGLLFQEATGIDGYQVVQDVKGKAVIRVVPGEGFSDKELERLREDIVKNASDLEVDFKVVDEIAPEASGKRRFTISRAGADFL